MKPLVSICIPTYNRAECLKRTIESIISQPEFKSGEVEIVVSDNASTDGTSLVCDQYSRYGNFFYHRNPENIRDKNFPAVLSKAHGKLRKLNNDTFVLENGSLRKLCDLAKTYENEQPFIFLSNEGNATKEFDFRGFVLEVGFLVTWLAGFTVWENECDQIESEVEGCELSLWQVRKAYELAYKKNAVVVFCQKLGRTIMPPEKDVSYGLFQVFYCNYLKLLQPYTEKRILTEDDINRVEKDLLFGFFLGWLIKWELNDSGVQYSDEENLKTCIQNQYTSKPYWDEFVKRYKLKMLKARVKLMAKRMLGKA